MTVCKACGQECRVVQIDNGVGYIEFWGAPSFHHDYVSVSNCCEADITEDDMEWSGV